MTEWLIIALMVINVALFAIGGTGYKWAKRIVSPIINAGLVYLLGVVLWKCVVLAGLLAIATSLAYGDRTPWPGDIRPRCEPRRNPSEHPPGSPGAGAGSPGRPQGAAVADARAGS